MTVVALGAVAMFGIATPSSARAAESFVFSFNTGDVAFAYSDGYWDHSHRWHHWHNAREAREFRTRYGQVYSPYRHTHVANKGWRDKDHDGVPNRYDRDRDGDGVPNRYDRRPDNPHR
jgi:hypothetical protein